jgi:exopolyphosphatase / guanosine-5'-triphosphate,3'-diphosphate pyrophosphatase
MLLTLKKRPRRDPNSPIRAVCEDRPRGQLICAAIDIGSNTTRILVAEPKDGQLGKVMEQRAYTRIGKAKDGKGRISSEKIDEVAEVVETQVKLAREVGAERFRAVATAAIRDAKNGEAVAGAISDRAGVPVEIVSEHEEGRLAFIGATKGLGHPVEGRIAVVDVGGGSTEITLGSITGGVQEVMSWPIGSGMLADEMITGDPPSASEIRRIRDRVDDVFEGVEIDAPDQAVAVGGSSTSLRRLVGVVLEYETLERGIRVLCGDPSADVARQFELDPVRVKILPTGVLILEKLSELLGRPLQIGKGGIREGIVLDMLNGQVDASTPALAG